VTCAGFSAPEPLVSRDEQLDGLGCLVADLLTDNLADGTRSKLLTGRRWTATINVVDAESVFVVELGQGRARVLSNVSGASSLRIKIDGDTLVALPEVPLVVGLPDPRTSLGRTVIGKLLSRELRIGGLLLHLSRLRRLLTLLNTA
jgi:hypothetical protein